MFDNYVDHSAFREQLTLKIKLVYIYCSANLLFFPHLQHIVLTEVFEICLLSALYIVVKILNLDVCSLVTKYNGTSLL